MDVNVTHKLLTLDERIYQERKKKPVQQFVKDQYVFSKEWFHQSLHCSRTMKPVTEIQKNEPLTVFDPDENRFMAEFYRNSQQRLLTQDPTLQDQANMESAWLNTMVIETNKTRKDSKFIAFGFVHRERDYGLIIPDAIIPIIAFCMEDTPPIYLIVLGMRGGRYPRSFTGQYGPWRYH